MGAFLSFVLCVGLSFEAASYGEDDFSYRFRMFGPGISPRDPARLPLTLRWIEESQARWQSFSSQTSTTVGEVLGDAAQVGAAMGSRVFAGETAQQLGDLASGVFFFLTLRPGKSLDYFASGLNPLKYINSAVSDTVGVVKAPFVATGTPLNRIQFATQELAQSNSVFYDPTTAPPGLVDPSKHVALLIDGGLDVKGHTGLVLDRPMAKIPVYSSTGATEWVLVEALKRRSVTDFKYDFFTSNCGGYADILMNDLGLSSPEYVNLGLGGGEVKSSNPEDREEFRNKIDYDMFSFRWLLQMAEFDDTPTEGMLKPLWASAGLGYWFQAMTVAARGGNPTFRKAVLKIGWDRNRDPRHHSMPKGLAHDLLTVAQGMTYEGLAWSYAKKPEFWEVALAACRAVEYRHPSCLPLVDQGPAAFLQGRHQEFSWEDDADAVEDRNVARDRRVEDRVEISTRSLEPSSFAFEEEAGWAGLGKEPLDSPEVLRRLKRIRETELGYADVLMEVQRLLVLALDRRMDSGVFKRILPMLPPATGMLAAIAFVKNGGDPRTLSAGESIAFARAISFLPSWSDKIAYFSRLAPNVRQRLALDFYYTWPNAIHVGGDEPLSAGSVRMAYVQKRLRMGDASARGRFVHAIYEAATEFEELPADYVHGFRLTY